MFQVSSERESSILMNRCLHATTADIKLHKYSLAHPQVFTLVDFTSLVR